jgi:hypothetical protein
MSSEKEALLHIAGLGRQGGKHKHLQKEKTKNARPRVVLDHEKHETVRLTSCRATLR